MKRVRAKSAEKGRVVKASIAESCSREIEWMPPTKFSAERRLRAISPKVRQEELESGSFIGLLPLGSASWTEMAWGRGGLGFVALGISLIRGKAVLPLESCFAPPPYQALSHALNS